MKFVVTNIQGGAGSTQASVVFQTPAADATAQPTPPTPNLVSTLNLTIPMTSAGDYVVGEEYDVSITKAAN